MKRFEEEALVSAQLQHPNIVPVHEMGQLRDGRPTFMREVKGLSLEQAIKEGTVKVSPQIPTEIGTFTNWLIFGPGVQSCCLCALQRILHRDLKPSNIMLGEFGEVYVVDWGVAKRMTLSDMTP